MKKIYSILFFILSFQCLAQKKQEQEYFNFTDTIFKINAIKRLDYIYPNCTPGPDGSFLNEDDIKNIDSIVNFLTKHKSIVLEFAVKDNTIKRDKENAEYFKSYIVDRGGDSTRIVTAGYGRKYAIHSKKELHAIRKKIRRNSKRGEEYLHEDYPILDKMNMENSLVELKILQQ